MPIEADDKRQGSFIIINFLIAVTATLWKSVAGRLFLAVFICAAYLNLLVLGFLVNPASTLSFGEMLLGSLIGLVFYTMLLGYGIALVDLLLEIVLGLFSFD